jgi:hypothetical protein
MAKAFLADCQSNHGECALLERTRLPTRVIDVSGPLARADQVKLYITAPGGEWGQYVTLSYCWGGPQAVCLKRDTIFDFTRGIRLDHLPRTLQDAITTTRRLGFRYLWVDALCIIQDSDEDKLVEIQNMGNVYRNSTLTISAARAETVCDGISPPTNQSHSKTLTVELLMVGGEKGNMILTSGSSSPFTSLPINRRGWTLQESILSRRTLAFGDEAAWMCAKKRYQPLVPGPISCGECLLPKPVAVLRHYGRHDDNEMASVWDVIVENFCRRSLTVADDRVWAIMGIMNVLEEVWRDKCLFGLWKTRFIVDAAWASSPTRGSTRSNRAPSWSWMSLDNVVHCGYRMCKEDAILISAHDRRVTLRAKLLPDQIKAMKEDAELARVAIYDGPS